MGHPEVKWSIVSSLLLLLLLLLKDYRGALLFISVTPVQYVARLH